MTAHLDKHEESKAECSGQKKKMSTHLEQLTPLLPQVIFVGQGRNALAMQNGIWE